MTTICLLFSVPKRQESDGAKKLAEGRQAVPGGRWLLEAGNDANEQQYNSEKANEHRWPAENEKNIGDEASEKHGVGDQTQNIESQPAG